MEYAIKRNGEKIVLTDEELNNLLILRDFNEFKSSFPSDDVFDIYMYLASESTDVDKNILQQAVEICGDMPEPKKNKKGSAFDNVDFDALEEEE